MKVIIIRVHLSRLYLYRTKTTHHYHLSIDYYWTPQSSIVNSSHQVFLKRNVLHRLTLHRGSLYTRTPLTMRLSSLWTIWPVRCYFKLANSAITPDIYYTTILFAYPTALKMTTLLMKQRMRKLLHTMRIFLNRAVA